ncbi:hydroxyacylglutathione hydrolase [Candidatus Enterovibrio escicola]|uniref:Hydroxyacylglutathione hydrolase n=1 Tax=Candidatus Enterovibrio escicola TaxID=1927127 RepID=A0A2A5T0L9_9GAMM|nr:hydroxyacylglutathione hydrolase [Candidatus Enterovibrio escacola]PCS21719.1 Hydroxyacylglutathione hydrolase [Candidatus Enterovibrio escacola]
MLSILNIPAFNDNYIWLLEANDNHCAIIDPGNAVPVLEVLEERGLHLDAILITHHHHDHVGGVPKLKACFHDLTVYGPTTTRFPYVTHPLSNNGKFVLFNSIFTVFQVPGHTRDHIAYYADGMLFCGDTLFSGGCGRLFEGTPAQMLASLTILTLLSDNTKVYCAHEYTQANLKFALAVEPNNFLLNQYASDVNVLRTSGMSTIPSSIGKEKSINPFLRTHYASVKAGVKHRVECTSDLDTFTTLRRWKDEF